MPAAASKGGQRDVIPAAAGARQLDTFEDLTGRAVRLLQRQPRQRLLLHGIAGLDVANYFRSDKEPDPGSYAGIRWEHRALGRCQGADIETNVKTPKYLIIRIIP